MDSPLSSHRLPTLTEVVQDAPAPIADPAGIERAQLIDQVLSALLRRIEPTLDARLREALAPALAHAAERAVHEARLELARTLRDLVAQAVSETLARRGRG